MKWSQCLGEAAIGNLTQLSCVILRGFPAYCFTKIADGGYRGVSGRWGCPCEGCQGSGSSEVLKEIQ